MAEYIVYVTRKIFPAARRELEEYVQVVQWNYNRPVPHEELLARIPAADGLLCMGDDQITREVIEAGRHLRVISTATAGYDHIDLQAAAEHNITVCHTPGAAVNAVADLTIALVLACARHITDAYQYMKNRQWEYWYPELLLGTELNSRTLGIIGMGRIGLAVAHRALGFGMRILYYDTHRNQDAEQLMSLQFGSLDNVLREADFITLHVPLHPENTGLIDERRLRLMKPTAYLINMARGPVVDHEALIRALRDGWIAGAGLDVYDQEPLPPDDPLLALPNVVLTPHIGANAEQAITTMMQMAAVQAIQVLYGQQPAYPVALHRRRKAA